MVFGSFDSDYTPKSNLFFSFYHFVEKGKKKLKFFTIINVKKIKIQQI
jgi:hypothetical protein